MSDAENQIKVEGDPNAVDSFAACLTAVCVPGAAL